MQPLSVLGPGASALAETLTRRLDGRVVAVTGVVEGSAGEPSRTESSRTDPSRTESSRTDPSRTDPPEAEQSRTAPPEADATIEIAPDGTWSAAGTGTDFTAVLDRFAPDYDFLIATDRTRLRVPTVLLGDEHEPDGVPGDVIVEADTAADVDVDALIDALEDAQPWIMLEELVGRAKADPLAERSGAIASFTGRVRAKDSPDDDRTTHLAFETYAGVAAERMDAIADELEDREGVFRVLMHHRTGVIDDGEDIVFVVVLAGHREEAFRTVEDGINRLKDEVPIFKKETTEAEEFWVHQRP